MQYYRQTKDGMVATDWETKSIPGYPGYQVATNSRVYGKNGRLLNHHRRRVCLVHESGRHIWRLVARLILEAFVGPCPAGGVLSYKNGTEHNYTLDNLCWE